MSPALVPAARNHLSKAGCVTCQVVMSSRKVGSGVPKENTGFCENEAKAKEHGSILDKELGSLSLSDWTGINKSASHTGGTNLLSFFVPVT